MHNIDFHLIYSLNYLHDCATFITNNGNKVSQEKAIKVYGQRVTFRSITVAKNTFGLYKQNTSHKNKIKCT